MTMTAKIDDQRFQNDHGAIGRKAILQIAASLNSPVADAKTSTPKLAPDLLLDLPNGMIPINLCFSK